MARYIDADALIERYGFNNATKYGNGTEEEQNFSYSTMMMYEIADMIDDAPTADVRENVRGEWVKSKHHASGWHCNKCEYMVQDYWDYNFCPNCGADMRGGE